jgi:hypothetical protein
VLEHLVAFDQNFSLCLLKKKLSVFPGASFYLIYECDRFSSFPNQALVYFNSGGWEKKLRKRKITTTVKEEKRKRAIPQRCGIQKVSFVIFNIFFFHWNRKKKV